MQKYEIKAIEVVWAVFLAAAVWIGQFAALNPDYHDIKTWIPVAIGGLLRVTTAALNNALVAVTTPKVE